ncbi:hypothetical protein A2311_01160 [candidate division WOR-1 bacterium RIFOXYB2_FULL_48_7]|uniref:Uncharacterized protein n=1 Tax=candidate division WOR-1 bacterium RIFOXYB2_FULL_48_7 TaxID=1802583 RepID=A0A1F4TNH9_UNCSA|nr:MAG: hypothetical protein A2311_01160 [candidate division WOR-1 bacterium RIFOXYB2_FULL_48_7]
MVVTLAVGNTSIGPARPRGGRIPLNVLPQGYVKYQFGAKTMAFAHFTLLDRCRGRVAFMQVVEKVGVQIEFRFFEQADSLKPMCTFYLDKENLTPYYLPRFHRQGRWHTRAYPILFVDDRPVIINGVSYYRGNEQASEVATLLLEDGKYQEVKSQFQNTINHHYIYDSTTHELAGVIVGRNNTYAFDHKLSGLIGPIGVIPHLRDGKVTDIVFAGEVGYYLAADDLGSLKINPSDPDPKVFVLMEEGFPRAVFASADQDFANPLPFRVVRDEALRIMASGRVRMRNVDLSGVRVIEGVETYPIYAKTKPGSNIREVFCLKKRVYPFDNHPPTTKFSPRTLTVVLADGEAIMVIEKACLDDYGKEVAKLAIAAYRHNIKASRIREISAKAFKEGKTVDGNYDLLRRLVGGEMDQPRTVPVRARERAATDNAVVIDEIRAMITASRGAKKSTSRVSSEVLREQLKWFQAQGELERYMLVRIEAQERAAAAQLIAAEALTRKQYTFERLNTKLRLARSTYNRLMETMDEAAAIALSEDIYKTTAVNELWLQELRKNPANIKTINMYLIKLFGLRTKMRSELLARGINHNDERLSVELKTYLAPRETVV